MCSDQRYYILHGYAVPETFRLCKTCRSRDPLVLRGPVVASTPAVCPNSGWPDCFRAPLTEVLYLIHAHIFKTRKVKKGIKGALNHDLLKNKTVIDPVWLAGLLKFFSE